MHCVMYMDLNKRRTGKDATKPRALGLLGYSVVSVLSQKQKTQQRSHEFPLLRPFHVVDLKVPPLLRL